MIPFYVVTCDKTAWILKSFAYLANKFWKRDYKVLGFKECPELPDNFQFISMARKQESIQLWTKYIYNILKEETSEFVIFGLDDYLFIDNFNQGVFDYVVGLMNKNSKIARYEFGWGAARKKSLLFYDNGKYNIMSYDWNAPYRISCQISVWRVEYLLKYLNRDWTPWQFEIKGSEESNNFDDIIICTIGDYSLRYIEESALSKRHPGMVNVLGLKHSLVDELVGLGYIKREQVQYGMSKGNVPINFTMDLPGQKYIQYYAD